MPSFFQPLCTRGYSHSPNDHSLFIKRYSTSIVLLAVDVDDIILTSDDLGEISSLKYFLDSQFKIKDLGILKYFLRFEVSYSSGGLMLHKQKFIKDLLQEYNLLMLLQLIALLISLLN